MFQRPTGWLPLLVLFTLTSIVESLAYGHFGAFTPIYLRELGVSHGDIPFWTGMLSGVGFVIGIPLLPFWGVWAERYSRKLIIVRSSYISAVLFAVAAGSQNVWMLLFARFLVGFVLGNTGVMLALQSEVTPRPRLGTVIGILSGGSPLGLALGPYFGSLIVEATGIRQLLLVDAILIAVTAVLLSVLVHEPARERNRTQSMRQMLATTYRTMVESPVIVRLFLAYFCAGLGTMLATPFVPLMIDGLYDGPALARAIGSVLTVAGIAQALATPIWGRVGDRFGFVRVLILCALLAAIALWGQAFATSLPLFWGWRVVFGIVQGAVGALVMALIALRVDPQQRAAVLTLSLLPLQFSWFLGPVLGALLAQFGLPLIFLAAGGLLLLTVLPVLKLLRGVVVQGVPATRAD